MKIARDELKSFVDRIERLEEEVKALNDDKSDIYKEAKSKGFDVTAMKAVIARRRKDPEDLAARDSLIELYLATLGAGTNPALRAHAHEAENLQA